MRSSQRRLGRAERSTIRPKKKLHIRLKAPPQKGRSSPYGTVETKLNGYIKTLVSKGHNWQKNLYLLSVSIQAKGREEKETTGGGSVGFMRTATEAMMSHASPHYNKDHVLAPDRWDTALPRLCLAWFTPRSGSVVREGNPANCADLAPLSPHTYLNDEPRPSLTPFTFLVPASLIVPSLYPSPSSNILTSSPLSVFKLANDKPLSLK
ncbi:hypothetical protein BJV74DRAFT_513142 [Russula compacta]|nr:hypothetical protein BJV74DRAFT_513142 [Russula compacta]